MRKPRNPFRRPLPVLALTALTAARAVAQQSGSPERQSAAYQASVTQDGLKRDAVSIRAELVRVRDQMRQLLPDDVGLVDRAIQQMDSLSRDEMERVVRSLRGASRPEGLTGQAKTLADALRDQGTISASLKRLAVTLDARQNMAGMSADLSALLVRQIATREELVRLSRREPTPDRLRGRDHERYDVVNEDQKSVSEDMKLLLQRIERVAATLTGDAQQQYARVVTVAREGKLPELADAMTAQVANGPFPDATATQERAVNLLVSMERALAGNAPTADRLTALREKLKTTLDEQTALTQTIAGFRERQSVESETKRLQTKLSDQMAQLRAQLQPLNAAAATDLQAAQESTEQASRNYDRMWEERTEAQTNTRNAVAQLTAALQDVDKQVAALPKQTPTTPAQLAAALAALARDTAQAAAAAQAQAANPAVATPDQQAALRAKVDDLQQRAVPVSPDAAQQISDAAKQLAQPGPAAAQNAAKQLAQAAQALAQQQAALEGRTPAQQGLAQAEAELAKANQELAQAQANLQSEKTSAAAVNQMNAAKQEVAAAQRAAQQAGAPAETMAALAEANKDLAQAQNDAAGMKLGQAQAAAKAAQQAMAKAGQGMEAARQAPAQQAMAAAAIPSKAGNAAGKLPQNAGGTPDGQGNGGGGITGDFLSGAGDAGTAMEPVSGLDPKDRAAVAQLQAEKPPAEFVQDVQQYYKNLADGAGF